MFRVITRGIRHQFGRSIVVLLLAAVATATAAATPAYISAAHQSLLIDTFTSRPDTANGLRMTATVESERAEPENITGIFDNMVAKTASVPGLDALGSDVGFVRVGVTMPEAPTLASSQILYRQGMCEHLELTAGDCETEGTGVLVSKRTAELQRLEPGDEFLLENHDSYEAEATLATVAGVYEPHDADEVYWGHQTPFQFGPTDNGFMVDAMLTTAMPAVAEFGPGVAAGVDLRTIESRLGTTDAAGFAAAIDDLQADGQVAGGINGSGFSMQLDTFIDNTLEEALAQQHEVSTSVPFVTVPLLLLAWFALFLVVARLSEQRAPQIALAKLRGHPAAAVTGFGAGESLLLIAAGLPLGCLLGWACVLGLSRLHLAEGTAILPTAAMAGYLAAAIIGGLATGLLACRPVLARPVVALLRRIPARARGRAGLVEGALVMLAAVSVWQSLVNSEAGVIGLIAMTAVAVVAGVGLSRLLSWWAARRLPAMARNGNVAGMLALAQVSRRGQTRLTVILVTVAATVVTFGVCAWGIADTNRELTASDELGADRVYKLKPGTDPQRALDAAAELDPDGEHLMAVVHDFGSEDNQGVATVAVQSDRLAEVARWRDHDPAQLTGLEKTLHPDAPRPLRLKGRFTVTADAAGLSGEQALSVIARIVGADGRPVDLDLGRVKPGEHAYRGEDPACADGCRLLGVGLAQKPGDIDSTTAELTVTGMSDGTGEVDLRARDCERWRPVRFFAERGTAELSCGDGLTLTITGEQAASFVLEYASAPDRLPAVLAGDTPTDAAPGADFTLTGPYGSPHEYRLAQRSIVVPRGGVKAILTDLDYLNRTAQSAADPADRQNTDVEIWANATAGSKVDAGLERLGLEVTHTLDRADTVQRLTRAAPAVSLRLYLVAAFAALAIVLGAILLTASVGVAERSYDTASLRTAGVGRRPLRRASMTEQLYWFVVPVAMGIAAGAAGLALVLPKLFLVRSETPKVPTDYSLDPLWPAAGIGAMVCVFAAVAWPMMRLGVRRGDPGRLREGEL